MVIRIRTLYFWLSFQIGICAATMAQSNHALVDEIVDSLISVAHLPGFSLAILNQGEIAYANAWGWQA